MTKETNFRPSLFLTKHLLPVDTQVKPISELETFHKEMVFFLGHYLAIQTHFHLKSCVSGLLLKQRLKSISEMRARFTNYSFMGFGPRYQPVF